jgi:hypothetical protein
MPAQLVDATPSDKNIFLTQSRRWAFCDTEGRPVEPLEGGTVVTRDGRAFGKRPTCPATVNRTSTKSRCASINAHARRWALKLRRVNYRPVLHRPLETTPFLGSWGPVQLLNAFTLPDYFGIRLDSGTIANVLGMAPWHWLRWISYWFLTSSVAPQQAGFVMSQRPTVGAFDLAGAARSRGKFVAQQNRKGCIVPQLDVQIGNFE